jgi:hypothetical protein
MFFSRSGVFYKSSEVCFIFGSAVGELEVKHGFVRSDPIVFFSK